MQSDSRLRVSVMGLFIQSDAVLMIHKMTGPEVDCWDLPGGGVQPGEPLMQALEREIQEETGLTDFQVQNLLTVSEDFSPIGEANCCIPSVLFTTAHSRAIASSAQ